jgi:hypothetical protein
VSGDPQMRRYHSWQRWLSQAGGFAQYAELWADQPDHPAREPLARLAAKLGREEEPIGSFLTRTLLIDVLHAGGGVEYHAERVLGALDQSQREHRALVERQAGSEFWVPYAPNQYVPVKESLAWEYPNVLTWLRAVEERIDRRVPSRSGLRVGLLPAIAEEELRADVERLLGSFKARVGDERQVANYGLHAAKVPDPNRPIGLRQEDDTIIVEIPDAPSEPVYVFDQFTYEDGRDLRTFAVEVLAATEELMDGLLDAFGRAHERIRIARRG